MTPAVWARFGLVAVVSAASTALLAALAPRLGWTDAPDLARKQQRRPVPAVGGAALLLGLACAPLASWSERSAGLWGPWLPDASWQLAALLLAFALGTLDDRRPLTPGRKLIGQVVALAPLGLGASLDGGVLQALALLLLGLAALNLLNTFDNADGALASLCLLGCLESAPFVSAACLGFLPFNLDSARARNRASGAPSAYLGDAGAFVLALIVLRAPASAGLFVLPALDLARLACARTRAGSRPWRGDRAHLAHRLEGRGLARPVVAALLCVVAGPACLGVARALHADAWMPALAGVGATAGLFAVALRLAPPPAKVSASPALPCSPKGRSE